MRLELKAAATELDRKRLTAEQLLNESRKLLTKGEYSNPQLSEKLGQALTLWRQLNDHYWQAFALGVASAVFGVAYGWQLLASGAQVPGLLGAVLDRRRAKRAVTVAP